MPLSVSAIITTSNRRNLVNRALASVLNQTSVPEEIIVIDDGSTDGTEKMISQDFPEVRYFWQENTGISAARNRAIREARQTWLAILDSDDEWMPQKIEKQKRALEQNPSYRMCHCDELWVRNGKKVNPRKIHRKYGGEIFERCLPLCVISPSAVMIHREVFAWHGHFDTDLPVCEDYDLWLRLCAFLPVLYLEDKLVVKYGGHADQLSKRYPAMDRWRITALEKIIADKNLDESKRQVALQMVLKKIGIYLAGAKKRGLRDEIKKYSDKQDIFQSLLKSN